MISVELKEQNIHGKGMFVEMPKHNNTFRSNSSKKINKIPEGYMTADEWAVRCKKNITEIFRKHEQGLLQ